MNLGETGWGGGDWIGLAVNREKWRARLNAVMNHELKWQQISDRLI
jgi:hypothetical protein